MGKCEGLVETHAQFETSPVDVARVTVDHCPPIDFPSQLAMRKLGCEVDFTQARSLSTNLAELQGSGKMKSQRG